VFDWNDLRHFLAVARHGSTLAAAKALSLSQSTVHRRLAELERRLGRRLVHRHATGYRLTQLGEELLPHAEHVEEAIAAFERRSAATDRELAGTIRLACAELLVYRITKSPLLDMFYARYPALRVEFVMGDRYFDLSKGEADIAIRTGMQTDGALVGRKIADLSWAIYASREYVERHGKPNDIAGLNAHPVIELEGPLADRRPAQWLKETAPHAAVAARNSTMPGLIYAVKSGVGLAPLPTPLGDAESDLVRVLGPLPELDTGWYLLTHPDLRQTPRIAAFFDFVIEQLDLVRAVLLGQSERATP
jgi:DNA-binding transcriptional LysR family regulator